MKKKRYYFYSKYIHSVPYVNRKGNKNTNVSNLIAKTIIFDSHHNLVRSSLYTKKIFWGAVFNDMLVLRATFFLHTAPVIYQKNMPKIIFIVFAIRFETLIFLLPFLFTYSTECMYFE